MTSHTRFETARRLADAGHPAEAARELRLGLDERPPYGFYARAQGLIRRLRDAGDHVRTCRIAILGTRTTALLVPILDACCFRDRVRAEIYEGLYGAVDQEVLDEASGLTAFRPDIVFIATHWRDLSLPSVTSEPDQAVTAIVEARRALWRRLADRFSCHVVQFNFDCPAQEPYQYLSGVLPGGRLRMIAQVNEALAAAAEPHVSILDAAGVQRAFGADAWQDPALWFGFQQHPSAAALPSLADLMAAHVRAVLGLTRKVLAVDLDNTLWKGVIGEDGLAGIQIGPGSPAGEAHDQLQQYILELKARGVLIAACSKNNPDDARLPFQSHAGMRLRLADFAAFRANWDDKAGNLAAIADELSLGLDSFVFLDDSPIEREWVRSQHADVAVVEPGESPGHYVSALDRNRYFFSLTLSAEDRARAAQYQSEAARRELRAGAASLDEFLADLGMEASALPIAADNLSRVAQLINKTNQFNATTRRYTEAQVQALALAPDGWARAFRLSDRMGDYGLIGVLICRAAQPGHWEIDSWLMSCRTLGRQVERFMFDQMIDAARRRGVRTIAGVYRPTSKNGLVRGLFAQFGFQPAGSENPECPESTDARYLLDVSSAITPTAIHIRDREGVAGAVA